MVVAYQQVETTPMRQFRCAMTGVWDLKRAPVMRTREDELHDDGEGRYWCAADKPETSDDALGLMVRPIYRTETVHQLARCETCGISIPELQVSMTEMLG